jgi:sugar phosphate isomerase/epimerase
MEVLGFASRGGIFEELAGEAFGVHIHDAVFIRDHKAPGTGEIPLESVLRRVPDDSIKIVELAASVPPADIIEAVSILKSLGLSP